MLYQTTLAGGPVPPPEPNSEIFEIRAISSEMWGKLIEQVVRAMSGLSDKGQWNSALKAKEYTIEEVFELAHRVLGETNPKGMSQRRCRCILAAAVGTRFRYEAGRWSVIPLRMRRPEWRWSEEWGAWYVVGMEREAVIRHEEEIRDLARVSERFEMAIREKRPREVGRAL